MRVVIVLHTGGEEKAREIAERVGGIGITLEDAERVIKEGDIVVPILIFRGKHYKDLERIARERGAIITPPLAEMEEFFDFVKRVVESVRSSNR